jgi:hypothetical protein
MLIGRLCAVGVIAVCAVLAQDRRLPEQPSPLTPGGRVYPPELNLTVGFGGGTQWGSFASSCSRPFEYGQSSAWFVRLSYAAPLLRSVLWGSGVGFLSVRLRSSYREREGVLFTVQADTVLLPVEFRNSANLSIPQLLWMPFLRWHPSEWLGLTAGPLLGLALNPHAEYTKELLQDALTLPDGQSVALTTAQGRTSVVERSTASARIVGALWGQATAEFLIAPGWWMSLGALGMLPLSSPLPSPASLRLPLLLLTAGIGATL